MTQHEIVAVLKRFRTTRLEVYLHLLKVEEWLRPKDAYGRPVRYDWGLISRVAGRVATEMVIDKLGTRPFRDDRTEFNSAVFKEACFFIRNRPNHPDALVDHTVNQPVENIVKKDFEQTLNFNKEC